MLDLQGGCTCGQIRYTLSLSSLNDARTTLCHCHSCKKAFGGDFGLTAKVPIVTYNLTQGSPKMFVQENGVHREFCHTCGSFLVEYGEGAKNDWRYVVVGSLDQPGALPPKGEFFTSDRAGWMPAVPSKFRFG